MNPKFIFVLAGALGILLFYGFSARAQELTAGGQARITGRIRKPTLDTIAVSIPATLANPHEHLTYARLNELGEFSLMVPVATPTLADLVYGDDVVDLYLDSNTDLNVRFRSEDMAGTVQFQANNVPKGFFTKIRNGGNLTAEQRHREQMANANNYLAEFDEQFVANDGFQVLPDNILLREASFTSFLDYRLEEEQHFLEDRAARQSFTPEFYKYARAEVTYSNLNDRLTYQDLREQVVNAEGRLTMTPTYYDFLRNPLLLSDPGTEQSEHFQDFVTNFIYFSAAQQHHQRTDVDFYTYCYGLASQRLRGTLRLLALGHILQESFRQGAFQQSQALLASYRQLDAKGRYWPALENELNAHRALAIGTPAPEFCLASASGETFSLSNFRGKLVYLSFWKTSSGPSLLDLAGLQDLNRLFAGNSIVFVSVNLDDTDVAWHQMLAQRTLAGKQLWAAGGLQSALARAYDLHELPAYFLIGEDGTMLNPKPKRPSSRTVADELNQSFGKAARYRAVELPPLVPAPAKPVKSVAPQPSVAETMARRMP